MLPDLLADQAGVVSRRQLRAAGLVDHDVRRLVRRRELVALHPGVYVDHTGPLTWQQRAWSAVLFAWPAALHGASAIRADRGPGYRAEESRGPVHVAIDHSRRVRSVPLVRVHRVVDLATQVRWNLGPPRQRHEDAVLDLAIRARSASVLDAVAVLTDAVNARCTTAGRLHAALGRRSRVPERLWWQQLLNDLAEGTCSVLEHAYLTRVERPHGLPRGERQRRVVAASGVLYRDVEHGNGFVVELDGRIVHSTAAAWDADRERDLDAALLGDRTTRLSYGQVCDRPCETAMKVALLLRRAGWAGQPRRCPRCP
ncbi:MAG: type IV toxin-antitoxin system AbiEi family antitoxin domain-containing protein [Nocardioides sp.]|nr:type IV toxin-antitoxin system AbiEi family antitoxin domain-containing protein [Nocardioides sp.]